MQRTSRWKIAKSMDAVEISDLLCKKCRETVFLVKEDCLIKVKCFSVSCMDSKLNIDGNIVKKKED